MTTYILYFFQSLLLLLLTPLFIGILNSFKAIFRGYSGSPIIQPYYLLIKLIGKGRVISKTSSIVTKIAPIISLSSTVAVMFIIPVIYTGKNNILGNIFLVIFVLGISKFLTSLLGLDCASTFGEMGSSREQFISMMAEPVMFILVTYLYMETRTFNIYDISATNDLLTKYGVAHLIAALAFFVLIIVENSRMPVDNPETHLELTMIHEAMILDISGKDLALIELASYSKLIIFLTIFINCFFPYGISTSITFISIGKGFLFYIIKLIICLISISFMESFIAKFKLFKIPEILTAAFSISLVAIALNYLA
jgi:formate hydrogenlyase subunit 4